MASILAESSSKALSVMSANIPDTNAIVLRSVLRIKTIYRKSLIIKEAEPEGFEPSVPL